MFRPHSLLAALVTTTTVVTAALCWAGWRLLDQQRAIDEQRARQQLESAADAVAAGVRGKLAEAGERLSGSLASPTSSTPSVDGAVVLTVSPGEVRVAPRGGIPFVPVLPRSSGLVDLFRHIETVEFIGNDVRAAADQYRVLARHRDARVRAGALLRLGRVLRKSGAFNAALAAYQELAGLGAVRIGDLPAEFAGLYGQRATLLAIGDQDGQRRVTAELVHGLDGRWLITRGVAEFYRDELGAAVRPESWPLAEALARVWEDNGEARPARGLRVFSDDDRSVLVMWRSGATRTVLMASFVDTFFRWPVPGDSAWQLVDPEGRRLAGETAVPTHAVSRIIGDAEYPWTLHLTAAAASPAAAGGNRRTLVAMMAAMLMFLWGATYFMARAIRREAAVARLQSDFVAAVSHEFRSPLTTIRQMAEMLEMGRLSTEERRLTYYRVLAGEAARLQRLVETLLNFGRMEAGAERYRVGDLDAAALVRGVVREMEPLARASGTRIEAHGPDAGVRVRGDESALAVALRNLIDNAIKYSPAQSTVSVQWTQENDRVVISVVDCGMGIPRAEQQAIFRKFVRGRAAIDANVKGTGVGLSMVQQIVLAHGGEVRLDSEPGRGSTFTLLLPLPASDSAVRVPLVPQVPSEVKILKPGA